MKKLSPDSLAAELKSLPEWSLDEEKLHRTFNFHSFPQAFSFMTRVAFECESLNHHPEWFNVDRTLRVWLTTHDVQGISTTDIQLAHTMDDFFA